MSNLETLQKGALETLVEHDQERRKILEHVKHDNYRFVVELTESPIELALLVPLLIDVHWLRPHPIDLEQESFGDRVGVLSIVPQAAIGPYRIDIALYEKWYDGSEVKLAIECDGHEFHQRTKEQAARDKRRDRFLLSQGWTPLRFTGSEIHRDAAQCVEEIVSFYRSFYDKTRGER